MYLGKTLFAQIMDFLPWKTFHRIVDRYGGDRRIRTLSCAEQFRVMVIKKQLKLDSSLHTLLQILSLTLFEKLPLQQVVAETAPEKNDLVFRNQLDLFEF